MTRAQCLVSAILMTMIFAPYAVRAAESANAQANFGPPTGWSSFIRGGAVYQFDTDLDEGGSYNARRLTIQGGSGYSWEPGKTVSLALGYGYDGYSFSNDAGIGEPWEDIHSLSLGLPMRTRFGGDWSAFLIPSIRSSGESGSKFDDTITGGVLTGFAYRFGDRLTIGPGIGVVSQIEESATVFPILIIDWKITDKLSLETGRGLGATLGPGLAFNYQANSKWRLSLGGRYEKLRFRLDENGSIPSGVGEDQSFPVFAACTYNINPKAQVSLIGGVEFGGELRVEDSDGRSIRKESYDPGGFLGFTFQVRM